MIIDHGRKVDYTQDDEDAEWREMPYLNFALFGFPETAKDSLE